MLDSVCILQWVPIRIAPLAWRLKLELEDGLNFNINYHYIGVIYIGYCTYIATALSLSE
jgi:hypothetical protein